MSIILKQAEKYAIINTTLETGLGIALGDVSKIITELKNTKVNNLRKDANHTNTKKKK